MVQHRTSRSFVANDNPALKVNKRHRQLSNYILVEGIVPSRHLRFEPMAHRHSPSATLTATPQAGLTHSMETMTAVDSRSRFSADDDNVITNGAPLDATQKNSGGAPIEKSSPMGSEIGWWSIVLLNMSMMIGTGIFSTPGTILKQTGSVGVALIYWVIGL